MPTPPTLETEVDHALCNYLAKLYHLHRIRETRYHMFDTIHISDTATCPIKMILDRLYEATPPCRLLYLMREGLEWEAKAIESLKLQFPRGETYKRLELKKELLGRTWRVVGRPDYYDYDNRRFIEIKWTRFAPRDILQIIRNKMFILDRVWPGFEYPLGVRRLLIWESWYWQVSGYSWLIEKHLGARFEAYIYANRGHHIDLIHVPRSYMLEDKMLEKIEREINRVATYLRYYAAKAYAPFRRIEDVFWSELRGLYASIWRTPEYYAKVEFQCRLCPYAWLGACPGLIPVRTFYNERTRTWLWLPEEIERIRVLMGISPGLQEFLKEADPEIYNLLVRAEKKDYTRILTLLAARHNEAAFIADMIRSVIPDAEYAFRMRPPRGRTIVL